MYTYLSVLFILLDSFQEDAYGLVKSIVPGPLLSLLILLIVFAWVVIWFNNRYHEFKSVKKDCEGIPVLEKYLKDELKIISENISSIKSSLSYYDGALGIKKESNFLKSSSPFELTDEGRGFLTKYKVITYIDGNSESLIKLVMQKSPQSPLDVETLSRVVLMEHVSDENFKPIKNEIFNNPTYKSSDGVITSVEIPLVISIGGIYLRDLVFKKHPELLES